MDISHVSEQIALKIAGTRERIFNKYLFENKFNPRPQDTIGPIDKLTLSYAYCGEQDFGLSYPLIRAFGLDDDGKIHRVPKEFVVTDEKSCFADAFVLQYGFFEDYGEMVFGVADAGFTGLWYDNAIIFCVTAEYKHILYNIIDLFGSPMTYMRATDSELSSMGPSLVIQRHKFA
ncbi:hypothetical protein FACS189431_1090 [Alphaproteobacteria bacterium]|nr:hypothetical protein FACS189431_1090 [Alphaproteobacteria bacterium]